MKKKENNMKKKVGEKINHLEIRCKQTKKYLKICNPSTKTKNLINSHEFG